MISGGHLEFHQNSNTVRAVNLKLGTHTYTKSHQRRTDFSTPILNFGDTERGKVKNHLRHCNSKDFNSQQSESWYTWLTRSLTYSPAKCSLNCSGHLERGGGAGAHTAAFILEYLSNFSFYLELNDQEMYQCLILSTEVYPAYLIMDRISIFGREASFALSSRLGERSIFQKVVTYNRFNCCRSLSCLQASISLTHSMDSTLVKVQLEISHVIPTNHSTVLL